MTYMITNMGFPGSSMRYARSRRHAPYTLHALNLSRTQNVKPHDDESEVNDYDSEFDAFT